MVNKKTDIAKLIDFCLDYIKKNNLTDITNLSPRSKQSFWYKVCVAYHGNYNFSKAMGIKNLFNNNSHEFETKVSEFFNSKTIVQIAENDDSNERNLDKVIKLRFTKDEWNSYAQYISKAKRKRFLTGFTRILATRMQIEGIKCWLHCVSNWFNDKNEWSGKYKCIQDDCQIEYFARLLKLPDSYVISINFDDIAKHDKIYQQLFRTRCTGKNRMNVANNLIKYGVSNTQAKNTINFFNPFNKDKIEVTQNQILKQIKYETKHENRLSTDILLDIAATKRLLQTAYLHYSAKLIGFIQHITMDPFGYVLISDLQIKIWRIIQKENPVWNFDATGSVIKNVNGQKKPLLYSIVSHDNSKKKIIPIGEFITTSHSVSSISSNLCNLTNLIKDTLKGESQIRKIAPIVVVDHSWTLIQSVLLTFNQINTLKYLAWAFEVYIENKLNKIVEYDTKIYICANHMLKLIIHHSKKILGVKQKVKNSFIYSFTLLQNTRNPQKFNLVLEHIFIIFNYKYLTAEVVNSLNFLQKELISRELEFSFDYYQNENLITKDYSKKPFIKNNKISEKENVKKSSPFGIYYEALVKTFKNKINIITTLTENEFFCPALFEVIQKKLYIAPMWCGFIFEHLESGFESVTRLSNNPVESWFNILKNKIMISKRVMPSEYLGDLYNKISSEFLDNYAHYYNDLTVTNIENLNKNEKNKNELNETIWEDKNLKRKKKNKQKSYYENSSIFNRAVKLINFDSKNIEKTYSIVKESDIINDDELNKNDEINEITFYSSENEEESTSDESSVELMEENEKHITFVKFENFKSNNINVCYANSALQSLLACGDKLFEKVYKHNRACLFSQLFSDLIIKGVKTKNNNCMSSENFRKLAQTKMKIQQDSFLNKKQQCSFSFLLCLLESSHHEIQNLFQVECINFYECFCGKKNQNSTVDHYININRKQLIDFDLSNLDKTLKIQEIIKKNCESSLCNEKFCYKKIKFNFKNSPFLILRIDNYISDFKDQNCKISKMIKEKKFPRYDKEEIIIQENSFRIIAAVSHYGTINNGHYECLRKLGSKWYSISDDKAYFCQDPSNNNFFDVYYFILEQII